LKWTKALCFLIFLVTRAEGRSFFNRQSSSQVDDPYGVLGVGRYASTDEIKSAYRAKAKVWHPDKNPNDPELASQKFREIAAAYEMLSDPIRKRQYDNQLRREQQNRERYEQQRRHQQERERRNRMQREREAASKRDAYLPKARKLQKERVVRITTIEDLEQIAFKRHERTFKTNVLFVFVANKKVEKFVDDQLLFPYISNIEGMKGAEDYFLPIKVRYNRDTDLTRMFQVPHYSQRSGSAFIVLGKKGQNLFLQKLPSYTAAQGGDAHAQFEDWVTEKLSVQVMVLNHHHSNVIVFQKTKLASNKESMEKRFVVKPLWGHRLDVRLGDTILAMDSNVDHWPGHEPKFLDMAKLLQSQDKVMLGQWRPWHDGGSNHSNDHQQPVKIQIHSKRCVDWSSSCGDWMKRQTKKPCGDQPEFLHSMCAKSCGVCHDDFPFSAMAYFPSYYGLLHEPLSYWPEWSHNVLRFVRVFAEDMEHVWSFRKNAGFAFFLGGILLGCMFDSILTAILSHSLYGILAQVLLWPVVTVGLPMVVYRKFLGSRHPFVKDMVHVIDYRKNVMGALVLIGFALTLLVLRMTHVATNRRNDDAFVSGRNRKAVQDKTKTD